MIVWEIRYFCKTEILQNSKFRASEIVKITDFRVSNFAKNQFHVKSMNCKMWKKKTETRQNGFYGKSTFFCQINVFTQEVTKELISRRSVIAFSSTFHTVLAKKLPSRNFFKKKVRDEKSFFPHLHYVRRRDLPTVFIKLTAYDFAFGVFSAASSTK